MSDIAVDVQDVSKRFRLYHEKYTSLEGEADPRRPHPLRGLLGAAGRRPSRCKRARPSASSAATARASRPLLKCICGVLQPTTGQVVVRGKLAGLLELGAGFQPELSGRENIYLNGSMLGLSKREIDRLFDDIVAFAELEQFIDNQVKFYSSGMYVRLGFAVAVNVDPDVLVDRRGPGGRRRALPAQVHGPDQEVPATRAGRSCSSPTRPTRSGRSATGPSSCPTAS